jgi:uncharacterized protein
MAMFVGVCSMDLALYGCENLKQKRGVVRRIIRRTQDRHRIAMSEIGELDDLDSALLGIAVIGNDQSVLNGLLDRVIGFVEELHLADVRSADFTIEAY